MRQLSAGGSPLALTDAYVHYMAHTQTRHETLVLRAGLLASDPQHVWQEAAKKAQGLVNDDEIVVNVKLGEARPADFTDNSTDLEIDFSFDTLPRK